MNSPVQYFKALADETRLNTLMLIDIYEELCVCELTEALELSQPKISRHLALLKSKGLLIDRKQGIWVYYRINPDAPDWITDVLRNVSILNSDLIHHAKVKLSTMVERPNRTRNCCD
jgi:ArsR family transcriptional regulator